MKLLGLFSLFLAGLIGALTHGANVYQWTDAEGKVHYSDTPPSQTTEQQRKLNLAPTPTNAESRSPQGLRPGELEMLRNIEQEQEQEQTATIPTAPAELEATPQTRQAHDSGQNTEPLEAELCAKYSALLEQTNTAFGARQQARQARANGDYASYRALRTPRLRRGLRQTYQEKITQHCQTP